MKRNNTIDLVRLLAAFYIVAEHADLKDMTYNMGAWIRVAGCWTVPFFFLASGYFLGHKFSDTNNLDIKKIEHNLVNLISIFVIACIIYGVLSVVFSQRWMFNDVKFLAMGSYWHLWFVGSMIFSYLFIWYIYKINLHKILLPLSVAILLLAILSDSYDNFLGIQIEYAEIPRYLTSIAWMYIGILLSRSTTGNKIKKMAIGLCVFAFVLQFAEMKMFEQIFHLKIYKHWFLIGNVLFATALFILCLNRSMKDNILAEYGRKYSLFIYLYHPVFLWITNGITTMFGLEKTDAFKLAVPLISCMAILGTAIVTERFLPRVFAIVNGKIGQ